MKSPEMNKSVIFSLLLLCCLSAQAQVVISMDQLERTINTELKYRLINAENGEGLSFASSYLIPVKDTLITNFAISDKDGNVNMKDVVPGEYELFVEMMGFKPYSQKVKVQGYHQDYPRRGGPHGSHGQRSRRPHSLRQGYHHLQRGGVQAWRDCGARRSAEDDARNERIRGRQRERERGEG